MPANNLRIIYNNLADTATSIVSSSSATGMNQDNLISDLKNKIWRTNSTTTAILVVSLASSTTLDGIALHFTNLTSAATIRVRGYTSAPSIGGTEGSPTLTGGTQVFDNLDVLARPWSSVVPWGFGSIPNGLNTYAFGGGSHARCWLSDANRAISCSSISITITDSGVSNIEASRLVVGKYWTPKYNTSYGISIGVVDNSEHKRSIAGNLHTSINTRHNTMTFEMKYMNSDDRSTLLNILKGYGIAKPLSIHLFPDDTDTSKERDYIIYGKLSELDAITHPIYETYSSQISVEEI